MTFAPEPENAFDIVFSINSKNPRILPPRNNPKYPPRTPIKYSEV